MRRHAESEQSHSSSSSGGRCTGQLARASRSSGIPVRNGLCGMKQRSDATSGPSSRSSRGRCSLMLVQLRHLRHQCRRLRHRQQRRYQRREWESCRHPSAGARTQRLRRVQIPRPRTLAQVPIVSRTPPNPSHPSPSAGHHTHRQHSTCRLQARLMPQGQCQQQARVPPQEATAPSGHGAHAMLREAPTRRHSATLIMSGSVLLGRRVPASILCCLTASRA